jgi:hypothetical protein
LKGFKNHGSPFGSVVLVDESADWQALQAAGATGLEPATSGVTGMFHEGDDWRRLTRNRSIHAPLRALAADLRKIAEARFRAFAALLLPERDSLTGGAGDGCSW